MCLVIVWIEGNIGVGKSTLLQLLEEKGCRVLREPLEEWEKGDLLNKMYSGELSRAVFQQTAAMTRWASIVELMLSGVEGTVYVERSPFSDRDVFAKLNVTNPAENAAYQVMHNSMMAHIANYVEFEKKCITVLLDSDVETAYGRMVLRDRNAETNGNVTEFKEYLLKLNDAHNEMFENITWEKTKLNARYDTPEEILKKLFEFQDERKKNI